MDDDDSRQAVYACNVYVLNLIHFSNIAINHPHPRFLVSKQNTVNTRRSSKQIALHIAHQSAGQKNEGDYYI